MNIVTGDFSLKCNQCNKQHDFTSEEAEFEGTSSSERRMGTEHAYGWDYTFDCDNCGNEIEIEYEVWEYPAGAFNTDDVSIKGGDEIAKFGYDFFEKLNPEDY